MRPRALIHRAIRRVTRRYPYTRGSGAVLRMLERIGVDDATGLWLEARPYADCPPLALDLRSAFQRRIYYFPYAHQRYYVNPLIRALYARTLSPGATTLDIGANLGFLAFHASRVVGPTGRVYAFEPDPKTFASLSRSAALQSARNVHCLPYALSATDQPARTLFRALDGTAHSLYEDQARMDPDIDDRVQVCVRSLDEIVRAGEIDVRGLALIKIDVEGEEAHTVKGSLETLERTGCPPIWVEVRGPDGSTRAPDTFSAVLAHVRPLGYSAFRLTPDGDKPIEVGELRGREDVLLRRTR